MKRVGFIINSRVPQVSGLGRGMMPHHLLMGWDDRYSPMSFMRFHWIANEVNRLNAFHYELYKPWRRYDAVVFLKSMGDHCLIKMRELQLHGSKVIFEGNIDYYTEAEAINLPGEIAPTAQQRRHALAMTTGADAVITSSRNLKQVCDAFHPNTSFIPDNILPAIVPEGKPGHPMHDGKLTLWWSGMASKFYDFLLIVEVLEQFQKNIHLHLVTGALEKEIAKWPDAEREKISSLLKRVPTTIHHFCDIPNLMKLYHQHGGVIISPRYMESPYNRSHTEWKLTLGLACGLSGLGSPLPSYEDAALLSGGRALTICSDQLAWSQAIEKKLSKPREAWEAGIEGAQPVMQRYGTPQVALDHASVVGQLFR